MNKLIKKFPHLTEISIDTIRVIDTFVIEQFDTTLVNNFIQKDCVIILNTERIKLAYRYDTITNEIIHTVKLPNDTIIKIQNVPVEIEKVIYKEISFWEKYQTLIYILIALFLLLVLYKKLTK
tara:strand:- start:416 stop:784 length:369 start_codon:yes stop_codon:yes gene_type:complete